MLANDPVKKDKKTKTEEEEKVILPKKTLLELGKLLSESEGDITYEKGENHLFFEVGGRILISRMIDAQFPAYERVIPKGNDKTIEFERDIAMLSVIGIGLRSHTGVGVKMFHSLGEAGINIQMINTSEIRISAVVMAEKGEAGHRCLADAFGL